MRGRNILFLVSFAVLSLVLLGNLAFGQFWFQSGANGAPDSAYNNGAGVYIQTVYPQNLSAGSFGFWVGETLQDGAFIQAGYEVTNTTGYYPQACNPQGCSGSVLLEAGYPTWFWEYFPANSKNSSTFYGGVGGNDSVGQNGIFNRYWFYSNGTEWKIYFNNEQIGSVMLGTSQSGNHAPVAYAELADANNNDAFMETVLFKNLSYYSDDSFNLLHDAYAYVGYGVGSQTALSNPYGVAELPGYADFFEIGSAVHMVQNGTRLWNSIYSLKAYSQYGNATGTGYYSTFSTVNFSIPRYVYISTTQREVFKDWIGSGAGSYTGASAQGQVNIYGNITETALWVSQYYLGVSSDYGNVTGSGWYDAGSVALVSLNSAIVNVSEGAREMFKGWSNGQMNSTISVLMSAPAQIDALWKGQYFVGLQTPYGNAIGSGWYDAGSSASISLSQQYFNSTNENRIAFYSWSGLYNTSSVIFTVNSPMRLNAVFKPQYLTTLFGQDYYHNNISVQYFYLDGKRLNGSTLLFAGVPYNLTYAYYKGMGLPVNLIINISGVSKIPVKLPVYDLVISAKSLLNNPLNASVYLTFRNGTGTSFYLGRVGSATLYDVPFGNATGSASYGFISERVGANAGSSIDAIFITPIILAPVIAVVAAFALVLLLHRSLTRRRIAGAIK